MFLGLSDVIAAVENSHTAADNVGDSTICRLACLSNKVVLLLEIIDMMVPERVRAKDNGLTIKDHEESRNS